MYNTYIEEMFLKPSPSSQLGKKLFTKELINLCVRVLLNSLILKVSV